MRILVMFDLPTYGIKQRRAYRHFRKYLITNGFMMLQESVYSKLALNRGAADRVVGGVKENKPEEGLVQILVVTEKQFSRMETVVGEAHNDLINSDESLVIF